MSVTNNCMYCINSHLASARAKGLTDPQLAEPKDGLVERIAGRDETRTENVNRASAPQSSERSR